MAKQILDTGTVANDNTGDTLRVGGQKINDNFSEVYHALGSDGTNISFNASTLQLDTLSDVSTAGATAGQYLQFNAGTWAPVTHEVDGSVTGHLIPDANVAYDLGSPTHAFRDLYLSSSSIHLGGLTVSAGPAGLKLTNPDGTEFVPTADANTAENVVEPAIESTEDQTDVFFFQEFYPNISDLTAVNNWNTHSSSELSSTTIGVDVIPHFPCIDPNQYADVLTSDPWSMLPGYEATVELVNRFNTPESVYTLNYISPEDYANGNYTEGFIFHLTTIELVGSNALINYSDTKEFTFRISSVLSDTLIKSSLIPDQDLMYDLGSPDKRFRDLYISGSTIHFGTASMKSVNGQIQLSAPLAPVNPEVVVFEKTNGFRCHSSTQITFTEEIPGILMNYELRQTAVDTNHTPTLKIGLPSPTVDTVVDFSADLTSNFPSGVGQKARYNRSGRIDFLDQTPGQSLGDFIEYTRNGWGPPVLAPGYTAELKLTYNESSETKIEIANSKDVVKSGNSNEWRHSDNEATMGLDSVDLGFYKNDATPSDAQALSLPASEGWYTDNGVHSNWGSGWHGEVHLVLGDGSTKIVYTSGHPKRTGGSFYTRAYYYGYLTFQGTNEVTWWNEVKGLGPTYTDASGVVKPRLVYYAYKAGGNSVVYTSGQDGNEFSIKNGRSISISGPGFTKVRESFNKGIDSHIDFKVYRNTIEERELPFHGTYVFEGARPVPDVDSFWFAGNQVIEMLPAAGSDLISRFAQGSPTRDRGWISKHTKVDFKMVKTDPKNKGDVLTSEGEQNLENKTLGKDGSPTYFDGSLIPAKDVQFDLGTPDNRFRDLYISSDSMHIGNTKLSTAGGSLQTFDVVYREKINLFGQSNYHTTQFDGNQRKSVMLQSDENVPYLEPNGKGDWKFMDGYEAKLIAHTNSPIDIYKKYPDVEMFEAVPDYRSTVDYIKHAGPNNWVKRLLPVFSDFQNKVHISIYELERSRKYKLVFKFMTGDWPVNVETTLCEWIITQDPYGTTTLNATANSKKIETPSHAKFYTTFMFYDIDGNIVPNAELQVDFSDHDTESHTVYDSGGGVAGFSGGNPWISGNEEDGYLWGGNLQYSTLKFIRPATSTDAGLTLETVGLTAGYRPPIRHLTDLHFQIEEDGSDKLLRIYGSANNVVTPINESYWSTDYENHTEFMTEYKIQQGLSSFDYSLVETPRTRPIALNAIVGVQSVSYKDLTTTAFGANSSLAFSQTTRIDVNDRLDVTSVDLNLFYYESKLLLNFEQTANRHGGFQIQFPYPGICGFVVPSFSYDGLISDYSSPPIPTTKNFFNVKQLDKLDVHNIPYKDTPIGLDQRLLPNFELSVSLYENESDDHPFQIYRQLSPKYYNFNAAGMVVHAPNDNNTEGLVLDTMGNLHFKARDENTIKTHFKQANKFKIAIASTASIREFSNFLDDTTVVDVHLSSLWISNQTAISASNASFVGEDCDIAAILAKANDIELEIVKEIVDPTTTELANTASDVADIQTELAKSLRMTTMAAPTANNAPGTAGDLVVDGNILYICVADDQWGRINLDFNW